MDIEQLKLILETVNAAGEGAYSIAIFWLVRGLLVSVLWWAAFVYVAYRITRVFFALIASSTLAGRLAVAMQRHGRQVDLSPETTEGSTNRDALVAWVRAEWNAPQRPPPPVE